MQISGRIVSLPADASANPPPTDDSRTAGDNFVAVPYAQLQPRG